MEDIKKFHVHICFLLPVLAMVLGQTNYRVVTIANTPYAMLKENQEVSGLLPDVLDRIGAYLNVTFTKSIVKDGMYGRQLPNGTWVGMIGELKRNEADIIAADLTITAQRAAHVDFSQPYVDIGLKILVRKTAKTPEVISVANMFFKPFQTGVWAAIICAYFLVTFVMYVIARFNPEEAAKTGDDEFLPLTTAFFMMFSMLSLQGFRLTPTSAAGRILVCVWWFFALVCITTYTAGLAAQLFVALPAQETPAKFYTFEQLVNQNEFQYGCMKNGSTYNYFRKSTGSVEKKIYNYLSNGPASIFVSSTAEGIRRVRDENYAFIMESESAYFYADQNPCDLMVVGEPLGDKAYGFACSQGSNICNRLNEAIIHLKQEGTLRELRNKWMSGSCGTYESLAFGTHFTPPTAGDIENVKKVDIQRFTTPLVILAIGIIIAGVVTGVEIMRYRHKGGGRGQRLPEDRHHFDSPADAE